MFLCGARYYGRVRGYAGQCAATEFGHVCFLPILPLETKWVTGPDSSFPIRRSLRSLAAAYLRVWGFIALLVSLITVELETMGDAATGSVVLAVLSAWSWTWRRLWRRREKRRALVHYALFGSHCDPLLMLPSMVARLHTHAEAQFATLAGGRTASEVARSGAASYEQAHAAYAVLRTTAALARGASAREARALSERALDVRIDSRDSHGGPYRRAG
jgi:hypothetical protein